MPPRKRARHTPSAAVSATALSADPDAMEIDSPVPAAGQSTPALTALDTVASAGSAKLSVEPLTNRLWTHEQTASLYKAVIRYKPAGMHRHFRMIAISEFLRKHGYDPDVHSHTKIPAIWDKLRSQYNLELIDERENHILQDEEAGGGGPWKEFMLPYAQFHEEMMDRCMKKSFRKQQSAGRVSSARRASTRRRGRSKVKDKDSDAVMADTGATSEDSDTSVAELILDDSGDDDGDSNHTPGPVDVKPRGKVVAAMRGDEPPRRRRTGNTSATMNLASETGSVSSRGRGAESDDATAVSTHRRTPAATTRAASLRGAHSPAVATSVRRRGSTRGGARGGSSAAAATPASTRSTRLSRARAATAASKAEEEEEEEEGDEEDEEDEHTNNSGSEDAVDADDAKEEEGEEEEEGEDGGDGDNDDEEDEEEDEEEEEDEQEDQPVKSKPKTRGKPASRASRARGRDSRGRGRVGRPRGTARGGRRRAGA